MMAEQEALKEEINEELHWSLQLVELESELKIMLMEYQIDIKLTSDSFQVWQPDLIEIQQEYNEDIVDAFNEAKELMVQNKERYTQLKKLYNEKCKSIDGYRNELNQKSKWLKKFFF